MSRRAALRGLHHVQLAMPAGREADAVAFYCGVLGLDQVAKPASLAGRGGCWFRSSAVELHIGIEEPFQPARKAHPALLVDDLRVLREQMIAAGVPVTTDEPLPGYERFYAADPFGNRIEFLEALR